MRNWPLTGRGDEIRLITEVLDGGDARGVLIAGPAGVGKTRLACEAADGAISRGWVAHRAMCTIAGRFVPLGAFASLSCAARAASGDELIDELVASAGGKRLLLCIDDAHLLDRSSAFFVRQLLLRGAAQAIVTVRRSEATADEATNFAEGLLRRVDLPPLSRPQSDELLSAALNGPVSDESAARLWEMTQGNVLFLRHLVEQALGDGHLVGDGRLWRWTRATPLSPALRDLVMLQLGTLTEDLREVVHVVSAAEGIHRSCLADLVGDEAIAEAERRSLVTQAPDSDEMSMGHPLFAEALLSLCSTAQLCELRGRAALSIVKADEPSAMDPIRLGLLWLDSDLPADPDVLMAAAVAADHRLDNQLAERFARAAVTAGGGQHARLRHARSLHFLGRGRDAAAVLDTVAPDAQPGDGLMDEPIIRASNLLWQLKSPGKAHQVIADSLRTASGSRLHRLRLFSAHQSALDGRPKRAIELLASVDPGALSGFGRWTALHTEAMALAEVGDISGANANLIQASSLITDSSGDALQNLVLSDIQTSVLVIAGYLTDAQAAAQRCRGICSGLPGTIESASEALVGFTAMRCGDLTTALRYLDPANLGFGAYAENVGLDYRYRIYFTQALAMAGRVDAALAALRETQAARHPSQGQVDTELLLADAWVDAARGRVTTARTRALGAAALARDRHQFAREVYCLQTASQFGDVSAFVRLGELATIVDGPRVAVAAQYARAMSTRDPVGLQSASRQFEDIGDVLAAASASSQAASAHQAAGRRGSALSAGDRAQRLAWRCGAAAGPVVADARLAIPFTPREREVAILVAQGLTDRAIAAALTLSVRTVREHVQRACDRSGAASRPELAALVRKRDLLGNDGS